MEIGRHPSSPTRATAHPRLPFTLVKGRFRQLFQLQKIKFFWGVDESAGWGRELQGSLAGALNHPLCLPIFQSPPSHPRSPTPRSRPRPPSPGPAFPAPEPPRPTQVAAAGSGCRRLRFPRPSPEPSRASCSGVEGGWTERRDTFFPRPLSASRELALAPVGGGGTVGEWETPWWGEKEESRNYRERK